MSAVPAYAPIVREVKNGGVTFNGTRYEHDALKEFDGSDVFLDMEVDVDTEMQCFRVYDAWQSEICVIELGHVDTIGEAANG